MVRIVHALPQRDRGAVTRRELTLLMLLCVVALVVRIAAVLAHGHTMLVGDQRNYSAAGQLLARGRFGWEVEPFRPAHPSAFKAPLYPLWVGVLYSILGVHSEAVELVQAMVSLLTILCVWLMARRLFGPSVAVVAAALLAIYPLAWDHVTTLYPEAIAVPGYAAILWGTLGRRPTVRRAAAVGAACGVMMLLRPASVVLLVAVMVAWTVVSSWRRAMTLGGTTVACAALVIAPWTIRNAIVLHAFIPISEEDSAIEGTFNAVSASDRSAPYAWRAYTPLALRLLAERPRPTEVEIRSVRLHAALHYIERHPASLFAAFFWNGLSRTWDIRGMSQVLADARLEGRGPTLARTGIIMYWILLPFALVGTWRLRRRKELLAPILVLAIGTSIVYTAVAGTRYRAPLEPVIAMLAVSVFAPRLNSVGAKWLRLRLPDPSGAVTATVAA